MIDMIIKLSKLSMIGRHDDGQLFYPAVEELDPTLAVIIGRPRLGIYEDIKIRAARIAVCSERQSTKELSENNQILAKSIHVRRAGCFSF